MNKPLNPLWPKLSIRLMICGLLLASTSNLVSAESADRDQPIDLEADSVKVDDAKQTSTYIGNVILTQGTLIIHAAKLIVTEDKQGFQHSTSLGNPTTFKQKLEGKNEYMQGSAQRIEYDGRMDKVQLYTKAWVKRGEDIVHGDYIMYDANAEYAEVIGGGSKAEAAPGTPTGRVRAIIQPKNKTTSDPNTSKKPRANSPSSKAPAVNDTPLVKDSRFSRSLNLGNDAD
jgi:lipopolysaccharide export system protein LptA